MISLEHANRIVGATLEKGKALGLKPLTVAVLDAGGDLVAFARSDHSSAMRPQIAMGKAGGALALGVSSRTVGDMAADRPSFIASLGPISRHGVIPAAGGVLITDGNGTLLGAVGVTGDTSDNDESCALAGIESAGLKAKN
ncbi:GlcG/HbpS family heme-binding protein [Altericroceibacterium endophyticum]|uniref:Heme-binding protein n=1 Tax=Altericroceibacterium endophyticum TaxID=1808508 RepID=A0A6I4T7F9_9SPHN|nr:heme-binding protein [Altericroceibacterium endophyticum]MXO66182.1 heme-binding protein [Altericroceibacterium endophyticum]